MMSNEGLEVLHRYDVIHFQLGALEPVTGGVLYWPAGLASSRNFRGFAHTRRGDIAREYPAFRQAVYQAAERKSNGIAQACEGGLKAYGPVVTNKNNAMRIVSTRSGYLNMFANRSPKPMRSLCAPIFPVHFCFPRSAPFPFRGDIGGGRYPVLRVSVIMH